MSNEQKETSLKDLVLFIKQIGYNLEVKNGSNGDNSMYLTKDSDRVYRVIFSSTNISASKYQKEIDDNLSTTNRKEDSHFGYAIKKSLIASLCHSSLVAKTVDVKDALKVVGNFTPESDRLFNYILKDFGVSREEFNELAKSKVKEDLQPVEAKKNKIRPA